MRCDLKKTAPPELYDLFQSLLGFLMRCDLGWSIAYGMLVFVSIPAGFSDALRLNGKRAKLLCYFVSIPAGFSDALRPYSRMLFLYMCRVSIPAGFPDALRP